MCDGAGADALPIAPFVGLAMVVDVSGLRGPLSYEQLERAGWRRGTPRLLLRTGASVAAGRFPEEWPALDASTAAALAADPSRVPSMLDSLEVQVLFPV